MAKGACTCNCGGFDHSATCPACTDYDPTVVVVQVDDWSVLYLRGKKHYEGHSIPLHVLAEALPQFEVRALHDTPFEESLYGGNLAPDDLTEVPDGN